MHGRKPLLNFLYVSPLIPGTVLHDLDGIGRVACQTLQTADELHVLSGVSPALKLGEVLPEPVHLLLVRSRG